MLLPGIPRSFQRLPCQFQKEPLGRIDDFCLSGGILEKSGIEPVCIPNDRCRFDIVGLINAFRIDALLNQLLRRKKGDGLNPFFDIAPIGIEIVGTGKTSGHADNRD